MDGLHKHVPIFVDGVYGIRGSEIVAIVGHALQDCFDELLMVMHGALRLASFEGLMGMQPLAPPRAPVSMTGRVDMDVVGFSAGSLVECSL